MAVKKNASSKAGSAASAKASKKGVAKKAATSNKAASAKPSVTSATSTKLDTPKAAKATPSASVAKKAAPKATIPIKLTERQRDFLKTIWEAKEQGFTTMKKAEQKTIDALLDRKLIKRGAKDKQSGTYRYQVSKAGEKHLASQA